MADAKDFRLWWKVNRKDSLPKTFRLLGTSKKIEKGEKYKILTAVLYLLPATSSGWNLCPWASEGCAAECLGHSAGRLAMTSSRRAQTWKTVLFMLFRNIFKKLLFREIEALQRKAKKKGFIPAIRLNGSSDILWDRVFPEMFRQFPNVRFYDYTKSPTRSTPANYHITYSATENTTVAEIQEHVRNNRNVAVVFRVGRNGKLPTRWKGMRVLDGDVSDVRFYDLQGSVIGLRAKGKALRDRSGFVHEPEDS